MTEEAKKKIENVYKYSSNSIEKIEAAKFGYAIASQEHREEWVRVEEVEKLTQVLELHHQLVIAHQQYLRLYDDECRELIGIAAAHGWRSTRHAEGVVCRTRIDDIEQSIKQILPTPPTK